MSINITRAQRTRTLDQLLRRHALQPNESENIAELLASYDRQAFTAWLQQVKEQEYCTAHDNARFVGTFVSRKQSPEDFIKSYTKANSYNNALKAVNHYCDFLGIQRPNLKPKPRELGKLIITPRPDEVKEIVQKLSLRNVKAYMALCTTVGLRPERLAKVKWSEIDFENGFVQINEKHGKKIYRPNCLHNDVAEMLRQLKQTSTSDRVFTFGYKKVAQELKAIGTRWRPSNMRDFFYNTARKYSDHWQIEFCMGHALPGVMGHYLADELKQEYSKFEEEFRLN